MYYGDLFFLNTLKLLKEFSNLTSTIFNTHISGQVNGQLEPMQLLLGRGEVHPEQDSSPSQEHTETNNHTHSPSHLRQRLESPVRSMFLDRGRNLGPTQAHSTQEGPNQDLKQSLRSGR